MNAKHNVTENRHLSIGGSDVAAALGLSRYKSRLQLYYEKAQLVEREEIDPKLANRGHRLEQYVADLFMDETKLKLHQVNSQIIHPLYPFMTANVDRRVVGVEGREGWEGKTRTAWGANDLFSRESGVSMRNNVPLDYYLQCLHYLAVTGWDRWYLAVSIGFDDFRWYYLDRDEEEINNLVALETRFWDMVLDGVEPDDDTIASEDLKSLLKRRYSGTDGSIVKAPEWLDTVFDTYNEAADALARLRDEAKPWEDMKADAEAKMLKHMQEAAILDLGERGKFTRRIVPAKEISYTRKGYVDFRYSKKPI